MKETHLQKAHRQNLYWPSLHSAVDVYLTRKWTTGGKASYELMWRLIHVWECCAVTLGSLAAARIRITDAREEDRTIREKCYGISRNDAGVLEEKQGLSAFNGSIDKWIEILIYAAQAKTFESIFLTSLQSFLNTRFQEYGDSFEQFIQSWGSVCDTPNPGTIDVKATFKLVNQFRTRFAHVPFPYDRLDDLYRKLEGCTFDLFSIIPATNLESPLSGAIIHDGVRLRGGQKTKVNNTTSEVNNTKFVFGKDDAESWPTGLFIHIDDMLRVHVLSRVKDIEEGYLEYTRYFAEATPVITFPKPDVIKGFPPPTLSDYPLSDEAEEKVSAELPDQAKAVQVKISSVQEAAMAIYQRNLEPAIEFLKAHLKDNPNYHAGWERYGYAMREHGVDFYNEGNKQKAKELWEEAITAFKEAKKHREAWFKAMASYHLSKTLWRLSQLDLPEYKLENVIKEAEDAAKLYPDAKFESWLDFVRNVGKSKIETGLYKGSIG